MLQDKNPRQTDRKFLAVNDWCSDSFRITVSQSLTSSSWELHSPFYKLKMIRILSLHVLNCSVSAHSSRVEVLCYYKRIDSLFILGKKPWSSILHQYPFSGLKKKHIALNVLSTDLLQSDLILFPFLWPVPTADYLSLSNSLPDRLLF